MKKIVINLTAVVLLACSPKISPDKGWAEKKWVLLEMDGMPVQVSGTDKDAHLVFNPADKKVSGTGGCNRLSGSYNIKGSDKISFSQPASTLMSCADRAFEQKFLAHLKDVNRFESDVHELKLKDGKKVLMRFVVR
jgi:heat shock protein HslJ